jgi:hypothetical protein
MLTLILSTLALVWFIGIAVTIYEIARAPIGPEGNDNSNSK